MKVSTIIIIAIVFALSGAFVQDVYEEKYQNTGIALCLISSIFFGCAIIKYNDKKL